MKKTFLGLVLATFTACSSNSQVQPQPSPTLTPEEKAMVDLLQSGQPIKCQITDMLINKSFTYLMKDGKLRMAHIPNNENANTASLIMDTEYVYHWIDQENEGYKTKVEADGNHIVLDLSRDGELEYLQSENYGVSCEASEVNDQEFIPPKEILFKDTEDEQKLMSPPPSMNPENIETIE